MKSDSQLQRDIIDELNFEPRVHHARITASVKDGVVTLVGEVESYAEKLAAERAAERVGGKHAVIDQLHVRPAVDRQRTDIEVAYAALEALRHDSEVPPYRFSVKVKDGLVTLQGTADWYYQRAAAACAIRFLTGVRGVENQITVAPPVFVKDVKKRINDALHRSASLDARRIQVDAADGAVTLTGTVRTLVEREEAARAAEEAPGVRVVNDRLQVSG